MLNHEPYANLNFGTTITTASIDDVEIVIDGKFLLSDFARAYKVELDRRNPTRANTIGLTEDELDYYFNGLVAYRVQQVNGTCKVWRECKQLVIPSWIEFTITQIGEVIDRDRGLRFYPTFNHEVEMDKMLCISDKLRAFTTDGVVLHKDAFPRSTAGDKDTMSMAIVNNYVQAQTKDCHPISSYVAAFLGFKLQEEATFRMLYRVRYDDVAFIRNMLLREGSLF